MSDTESTENYAKTRLERGWKRYERKRPRSLIPYGKSISGKPLELRSLRWLLPWTIWDYPGVQAGSMQVLSGRVALETLRSWWKGYHRMPRWAADAIGDAIEARLVVGYALLKELRAYSDSKPDRRYGPGFRAIDPETGLSGRPRVGRKKAKEV